MKRKKIMLVFGTRPEAIKMAPIIHVLKAEPEHFELVVCVTSQHREMLDQVLKIFEIKPDIDLDLMKQNQNLLNLTSVILRKMQNVFDTYDPDLLLVHGDTTTTLAASMAAFYASIPVGHVEAGLRTFNIKSPFPEEFNRQITSKISRWHFAPTKLCYDNLLAEGVEKSSITVTGNTVIDALHFILKRMEKDNNYKKYFKNILNNKLSFDWESENFIIITAHRRENFGEGLKQICDAIRELALKYKDNHFVYCTHLNPNVRKPVYDKLSGFNNIHLIKPLDYESFVCLLKYSYLVLTDSGGIQEEAPSLGKPVLLMRDISERPEAINAGTVEIVGSIHLRIVEGVSRLIEDKKHYQIMSRAHNPYGDGFASEKIKEILKKI